MQSFLLPADAYIVLYIVIPGRQICITYRPVYTVTILHIGLKIQVAVTIALPAPGQASATHLVTPHPVEWVRLYIGMFTIAGKKKLAGLIGRTRLERILR